MKNFILIIALIFCFKASVVDYHPIPSGSMIPTLEVGDIVLVNRLRYGIRIPLTNKYLIRWAEPSVSDVVVFEDPLDTGINSWIKRVIATEGQTVSFENESLFVDGQDVPCIDQASKEYYYDCTEMLGGTHVVRWFSLITDGDTMPAYVVPANHVFLAGDNRNNSMDSRFVGAVPVDSVYGRMFYSVSDVSGYINWFMYLLILWIAFDFFRAYRKKKKNA